ncbi:NAD(P)-dependent oxidoreductase [Phytoactinopolyspora halotolerans]|uniref:SDR family oxidoreductase n=1 Tax=Phytoactinopolyspora halotolerans TaxID=1981512 RepID=A0A6L9SDH4_9ACTN|nr:SDR family oxidoreductase [Phytoactinopolyspora halotolerans]NEE03167.1 SDR family oxidoreductase [Phytoactinopolyspora halotolerans]
MKLVIIGATGRTGRHLVQQALDRGYTVTAPVRHPEKLADVRHERLTTVEADIMDPGGLAPHLREHNAVLSTLGPTRGGPATVCADGTRAIVEAMYDAGPRRLVTVSVAAAHTAGDGPFTRLFVKPMLRIMLRRSIADALEMERILQSSALDWTTLRPPMLTGRPFTGEYRTRLGLNVRGGYRIARADLAHAILAAVEEPNAVRTAVGVAA